MKKLWNYTQKMFFAIFPFIHSYIANKKIEERLNCNEIEEIQELPQSLDELREVYKRTLEIKDKLEDKAKNNIIAITISITLIMGASNIISNLIKKPLFFWMPSVSILLFVGAVGYMIVAGSSAFKLLMDKNVVYYVLSTSNDESEYYESKESNNNYNLIRNNLINTSFRCIRNAIICLFIVLMLIIANQFNDSYYRDSVNVSGFVNINIFYSNAVIQDVNFLENRLQIESLIWEYYKSGKLIEGESVGLVDAQNNLFVKVNKQNEKVICVELIERVIP